MGDFERKVLEAVEYIKGIIKFKPDIAIILGAGLNSLAYEIQTPIEVPFEDIPHFKSSTVPGTEGKLIFGLVYDRSVVALQGRLHCYDGYSMEDVTFTIRVFTLLGVEVLIVTSAVGGVNPNLKIGDLVLVKDHLGLGCESPLIGPNYRTFGPRFPSLKGVYERALIDAAKSVAAEIKFNVTEGVYAFMTGPQYTTEAEAKMFRALGADVVGFSMVPEVIVAAHSGMSVLGIAYVTNVLGVAEAAHTHNEILEVVSKEEKNFTALVLDTIKRIEIENEF